MTALTFMDASGKPQKWNGQPTQYGGQAISSDWVAAQDREWAVPGAFKLFDGLAAICDANGDIMLDKNLTRYRKQLFFPEAPVSEWKIDTCHADSEYPLKYAKYHSGWDINYIQGGNSEYGFAYKALADGIVVFVSDHAGGAWGGLVVVWHPQFGFASRYGHHKPGSAAVQVGDIVRGGETVLARIGRGENNAYFAHLHQDLIKVLPPRSRSGRIWWAFWPNNDLHEFKATYTNPEAVFKEYGCQTPPVPQRMKREAR